LYSIPPWAWLLMMKLWEKLANDQRSGTVVSSKMKETPP
jgi:hypothetical protein